MPLVMLPGWGLDATVFAALRDRLSSGLRPIAFDLPGYREAAAPEPYTLAALAAAVAERAPAQCFVLGWSLGAQIALEWARTRPAQVRRLALVAATPSFVQREDWRCAMEPAVFESFATALRRDSRSTLERFATLQARGDESAKRVMRILRDSLHAHPASRQDVLEKSLSLLRDTDLRAGLSAVKQPALLVHGERDGLVPVAAAEHLARALPDARLLRLAGAAHAPFLSDVEHVAERLAQFFDE